MLRQRIPKLFCSIFGHSYELHHTDKWQQKKPDSPGSPWLVIHPNGGVDTYRCQRCGKFETGIMVRNIDWEAVKRATRAMG